MRQAEIDGGLRPGSATDDTSQISELEREVRELRRANEILCTSAAFSGSCDVSVGVLRVSDVSTPFSARFLDCQGTGTE